MRFFARICAMIWILLLLQPFTAVGAESIAINAAEDTIWEDFSFSVSDTCINHDCFYQISAESDGSFIVVTRYTNIKEIQEMVYRLCYIDVYSASGQFVQELSFYTEQDFAAELQQSKIHLYFYDRVITYDLRSETLDAVFTEPGLFNENGTFAKLRQASFQSGKWQYHCKKGFHGYTKLTRTDGINRETLISYSGTGFTIWNTLVPATVLGLGLFLFAHQQRKRRLGSKENS